MITAPLTINGLFPPDDFPAGAYEAIHAHVIGAWTTDGPWYEHYSAAWNAVAYRFKAAVDAADRAGESMAAHGSAPTPEERFKQDAALADLFNNGYSAFEAVFYALTAIGTRLAPATFALDTAKQRQKVSPTSTTASFKAAFPDDPVLACLDALFADAAYGDWREIRNVLTHRTSPGRTMYVGLGADDAPETEWKLKNIPLEPSMAAQWRGNLARLVRSLLIGVETFVAVKAGKQP